MKHTTLALLCGLALAIIWVIVPIITASADFGDVNVDITSGYGVWGGPSITLSGTVESGSEDLWVTIQPGGVITDNWVVFMHTQANPIGGADANAQLDTAVADIRGGVTTTITFEWASWYTVSFFGGSQTDPDFGSYFGTLAIQTPVTPTQTYIPIVLR